MRKELADIVGKEHLDVPDSGAWVARPGTIEETSEIVRLARRKGWTLAPRGGGTRADPAAVSAPPDLVVETTRLSRVIAHSPEDLTAHVECGIALDALQTALAERGQFLPLDPAHAAASTLGGVLATNAGGSLRFGFGTARDRVIGLTVVRHDGRIVRSGGGVVKNVAGYDLAKLYLGSWGALGILVSVNLKLAPRPGSPRGILSRPRSRTHAFEYVTGLLDRGFPMLSALYEEELLTVGFALPPEVLELDAPDPPPPTARPPAPPPSELTLRLCYPPGLYVEVMESLEGTIPGARESSLLHSGVTWLDWETAPAPREGARMAERIDSFLAPRDGHVLVERMPPAWVPTVPRWRAPAGAARLMARIKSAFDPDGIFPPLPGAAREEETA